MLDKSRRWGFPCRLLLIFKFFIYKGVYVMDFLKKFWPMSFKNNDSVSNLVIGVIVYVVVAILAGVVIALAGLITGWIPVVGAILGILLGAVGTVIELYTIAGIVFKFLAYFKVFKD